MKVWFLKVFRGKSKWLGQTVSFLGKTLVVDGEEGTDTVGCPVKVSEYVG